MDPNGDQLEAASDVRVRAAAAPARQNNMLPQLAPLQNPNTLYTATPLTLRPEKNRNLPVRWQQQQQLQQQQQQQQV